MKKVHVISGLPRSGSTLLSAILRQNPRFFAAVTSPVVSLCEALLKRMSGAGEFGSFFDDSRRASVLRSMFEGYYEGISSEVVFDTNRIWTAKAALLDSLYPDARIICCVRDVGSIIDSIERMLRRNPLRLSRVFGYQSGSSIYSRVDTLMNSEKGLIGLPWSALREVWYSENTGKLIIIPYDTLVGDPTQTIRKLYTALGEPQFEHDFTNVVYDTPDYDLELGMPGLHAVRSVVKAEPRQPCVPPDVLADCARSNFWTDQDLSIRRVTVL